MQMPMWPPGLTVKSMARNVDLVNKIMRNMTCCTSHFKQATHFVRAIDNTAKTFSFMTMQADWKRLGVHCHE